MSNKLNILQINTTDCAGGAAKVCVDLANTYRVYGHSSWLAVGEKCSKDENVFQIDNKKYRTTLSFIKHLLGVYLGHEDFEYPATAHLLELPPAEPDILHCHNMHGYYFDLRELPRLSLKVPVIITLHDAWLLSGHCAHSFDCEKWKTDCKKCPDLTIIPSIKRDAAAFNLKRKRDIYSQCQLYIATPSAWLMDKVNQSPLKYAAAETRVIPNGIDLSIFYPADKELIRAELGIPEDAKVLLFTANGIRTNIWKDYKTMRAAIDKIGKDDSLSGQRLVFIALGEDAPDEHIGDAEIHFVPYQEDPKQVAKYYQATDLYIHAARVDTFPNVILEALACGVPVVATAVGGIPEQIENGVTGYLTSPGNAEEMAKCIIHLLKNDGFRKQMSENAAEAAKQRFDLKKQAAEYLQWYDQIISRGKT